MKGCGVWIVNYRCDPAPWFIGFVGH